MTRISSLAFALVILNAFGLQSASAQAFLKVPRSTFNAEVHEPHGGRFRMRLGLLGRRPYVCRSN